MTSTSVSVLNPYERSGHQVYQEPSAERRVPGCCSCPAILQLDSKGPRNPVIRRQQVVDSYRDRLVEQFLSEMTVLNSAGRVRRCVVYSGASNDTSVVTLGTHGAVSCNTLLCLLIKQARCRNLPFTFLLTREDYTSQTCSDPECRCGAF